MQEVQRFNKVLKSFVLLGDIILLNLLLWMFTSIWENRSLFEYSMPLLQNMALMTLCYLVCNIRSHSGHPVQTVPAWPTRHDRTSFVIYSGEGS